MSSSSFPRSPAASVSQAEFLLSLFEQPERSAPGGPRVGPSEAELLIDPVFYAFLSGLTVVLLLLSSAYCLAWLTLTSIRRRQYRKYRQRRLREEERQRMAAGTAAAQPALPPSRPPPAPPFVASLQPLSSSFSFSYHPLYSAAPAFLSRRGALPALLAPLSSALSAAAASSAASPARLSRLSLALASPSALPDYLMSMLTPRRKPAAPPAPQSPFHTPFRARAAAAHSVAPSSAPPATRAGTLPSTARRQRRAQVAFASPAAIGAAAASPGLAPALAAAAPAAPAASLSALHQDELDAAQHEHNRGFLSFSLSTLLLTVGLLWLALIPLTLTFTTPRLTSHYLLSWLTPSLVSSLWSLTTTLSSLCLFLVAPFAYLYYEAEGLFFFPLPTFLTSTARRASMGGGGGGEDEDEGETSWSFGARCMETGIVLLFSSVMLYGSVHLLHAMTWGGGALGWSWGGLAEWMLGVASLRVGWLLSPSLLSNVLHFFPGLLLCLLQSHCGFSSLLSAAFALRIPFYYRHFLRQQLDSVQVRLCTAGTC